MSDTLARSREEFLHRYAGLRARLPGDPGERQAAAGAFARLGLPGAREEAWKYTSLRSLAAIDFFEPVVAVGDGSEVIKDAPLVDAPRLVFVDGRLRADLCSAVSGGGFAAHPQLTGLARPDRDPLAALNTMLAEDGATIVVPAGVDAGTLQILSCGTDGHGRAVAFHPRHRIELGDGARLTVVEIAIGQGVYLHNPVTEIVVGDDARLTHLRLQDEAVGAFHLATLYVEIGARAHYESFLLNMGAQLSRSEVHARMSGDHAVVQLNCAQLLRGIQHGDFTTVLAHDAVAGRSRQTVRNVLDEGARGVFQGRIDVARIAQKTDGFQMNHALLLSPGAEIDSKPELRIHADDVKCSHGATVGELDADQLFYLRSRGVPVADARAMLIRGFLAESLADVGHAPGRALFEDALDRWWERRAA